MDNPKITRGGLRFQLESFAECASDEGSWNQPKRQQVMVTRKVGLADEEGVSIETSFEAYRFGEKGVHVNYFLTAMETRDRLTIQEIPEYVTAYSYHASHSGENSPGMTVGEAFEGFDEYGDNDDDDARFRHEKSVQYRMNGAGCIKALAYTATYIEVEDDDETELYTSKVVLPMAQQEHIEKVVDFSVWPFHERAEGIKLKLDYDLRRLDQDMDVELLREDMQFLEITKAYAASKELRKASRREALNQASTLLAFLRYEKNVKDIRDFI